jgi:phosphonopyruvate decarboxylase
VNPLLSLFSSRVYSIPTLMLIGWRGEPGKKDEPQHMVQGSLTWSMLEQMGVPCDILPDYEEGAREVLDKAYEYMKKEQAPFALLVKKQTFAPHKLQTVCEPFRNGKMLTREDVLQRILTAFPNEPIVTTTGFTSRELFELRKASGQLHDKDFLTVGSMGHCSSIALGVALSTSKQVVCVDGDGAALMHMGAFASVGKMAPKNFKHVLINNAVHDSVGGQPTGAAGIDFPAIARACGYKVAECVASSDDVDGALSALTIQEGPCFLEIRTIGGARSDLGRPTTSTHENKKAFMSFCNGTIAG